SLTAANTYTGTTSVSAGVLQLGVANALANTSTLLVNGGGFNFNGNSQTVAAVTLSSGSIFGSGTLTAATYDLSGGTVASTASLGAGTMTVTGNSTLHGTSGATALNLNAGTLTLGGGSRFTSSSVAVTGSSGGALALGGNETFGSLAGAANVALGGNTLSVGGLGTSTTYSGAMSGAGGLEKTGAGSLTLSAANTYTGNTVITGGTLALGSLASLASGTIQVGTAASPNGALDVTAGDLLVAANQILSGYGTVLGDVVIANGAIVSPGGSVGVLATTGNVTFGGGGRYLFEITSASGDAGTGWDLYNVGTLDITSGPANPFIVDLLTLANPGDQTPGLMTNWDKNLEYQWKFLVAPGTTFGEGNFDSSWFQVTVADFQNPTNGSFSVARGGSGPGGLGGSTTANELYVVYFAIPEPSTLALASLGLAGLAWRVGRRRRAA
ncbi:MAG: autotransporter-associated beta strand repeat-containing protein, partial [Planctomycetaceae bacterium]